MSQSLLYIYYVIFILHYILFFCISVIGRTTNNPQTHAIEDSNWTVSYEVFNWWYVFVEYISPHNFILDFKLVWNYTFPMILQINLHQSEKRNNCANRTLQCLPTPMRHDKWIKSLYTLKRHIIYCNNPCKALLHSFGWASVTTI